MVRLRLYRWWMGSLGILLAPTAALAQAAGPTASPLQIALCLNNWNQAIELIGPMMAAENITPLRRRALVEYRQQLIRARDEQLTTEGQPGCEQILARYLLVQPEQPSPPLDWEGAIAATYGIGSTAPGLSSQAQRQEAANIAAGLLYAQDNEIESLSPFRPLETTSAGAAISAGAVSNGYEVYSFVGGQGDQVTIRVDTTEVYTGSLYTDDDSQLFLFDSQGTLLAENDDFTGLQSVIGGFVLPATDRYYVAVTTYNNDPILNTERRITDWSGSGGSDIDFTISITGLTPVNQLVLPR